MALPTGADLLARLGVDDLNGTQRPVADQIAASALAQLAGMTGLTWPATTYADEAPFVASYSATVVLDHAPVITLTSCVWTGTRLRIGTLGQLYTGDADVAIAARGDGIELAGRLRGSDRRGLLLVSYAAGLDAVPTDLYDAFAELALIKWHEMRRAGLTESKLDQSQQKFSRTLSPANLAAVGRYRRYAFP